MNNYKRILSLILALILTLAPFTTVFAQTKTPVEKTRTKAQEIQIGDNVYYIFSKDKNAKSDLTKSLEKNEENTEEIQTFYGLEVSDSLFDGPVRAGETTSYTLNIKGNNFLGVGGKTFDWDTLPEGLELQVWYLDEDGLDVNIGNPITINKSNYQGVITRTFEIAGQPLAFGMKTNVDTETYLTDVYLTNEQAPDPWAASLDMTFDLVQVPSTKLSVKWVDVNQQPLARENTPATSLKDILTFNFIEGKKFDLPNQDKEDPYFRLVNKIERKDVKDMEGATALVDGKKDGEVTLDGKTYKLTTSYNPALNEGSKIQLMFMPDVIDRTKNPDAGTPENYVRVTIDAGEGTKLAEGETKKVYDVRVGKALKAEQYPKLDILEGHKEPITWTIAPETAITKAEDILGKAAKTAAETITVENLKPVDTTALQGQDLPEKFWNDGVALADTVEEAKKAEFQALLKDATVTDITDPERTTAEAGDKVGTLLVTFKDGSKLEVPNQKLIVKPNTVEVSFDNEAGDDANAPRHKETIVKGKISSTSGYPVKGAKVEIKDEASKVIGITLADENGNFTAGTRELKAGEKLTASVTLPDSKLAAESTPKTVKLNPDRLNELLPIAKAQKENFSKKQNAIIKKRLEALNTAITNADPLVKDGKATATDTAENQTAIDNAVKALEDALKALTANIPPSISGPKTHEIFVGEDLDLKALVDVTDGDGADDLVVESGSNVKITAVKVDGQTESPITDLTTIKDTVGTYKVTYTAKDKSDAEVTHEMTLTVKPRTTSAIEVTTDPTNMSYLITEKDGKATLDLTGMTLNLVDNLGKKTKVELTDPNLKLKVNGRDVTNGAELTLDDDVKFIEVEYTPEGSQTPLIAKTDGVLRVGPDYDGDGKDDRTQDFDPDKIEKLEVIKQPQLDYIAKDKSEADKVFKLNLEGMIVRMTDKAGKEKLALVKDGKFYDYDEQTKEITVLTAAPAHGATLTPETSATEKGDNGKTVKITGPNNSEALTEPLKVFYDANGDNTPDHNDGQKTPAPSAMARNVGDNPQGTTVEGMATPGAVIKIYDSKDKEISTEKPVVAGPDGKYTATVKPILADGTDIKVTAKLGEMGESDPTPTTVFDDKNDNKQPDRDEGFNIEKVTDIKFVDQPDLTYLVPTKDTEVIFDGKDGKGKAIYLELSYKNGDKTESKIMTLEELMKDTDHIAVTPANGTKDKIGNNPANLVGKAIDVKLVKADKTATSTSTFAIKVDANNNGIADEDEKTPAPTAKAFNVGKNPTSTTITGKAEPNAKVVAKVDDTVVGEATADSQTGEYTIEAKKDNAALPKDTKVQVTAKDGEKQESDPTDAIVKEDKDGNGVDDDKEKFDIKKATKVEIIKNPDKMDYLVNTTDGKAKFETKGLVVKFTDDSGKSATYTAEELANMNDVTIKPANNEEIGLTPEGKTNIMDLTVTVTGAEATDKPTVKADRQVIVKLDADKNGIADEDEKTPEPDVMARNIGKDPKVTTVEVETEKNADVTIEYKDANGETKKIEAKADDQGKLTKEIKPKLEKGTDVKVTVKDGEKQPTEKTVKVFDDVDDNKIPDDQAGQTERPAAIASNIGKEPKFTTITGEAEKGATVTAKVGTEVVGTATVDSETGKYTIEAKQNDAPIKEGVKIDVTATLAPKTESLKQTVVVFNDTDGTGQPDSAKDFDPKKAIEMQVVASPDKMVYNDGDKLNLDGLKVLLTDVNGNQKIFTYKHADNTEFTNAGLSVDYKQNDTLTNDDNGKKLTVTLDTRNNNEVTEAIKGETPTALTVNKNQSAQPTDVVAANQGDATVTKVKGKATKGAEIKITDADGNSLLPAGTTVKANDQGEFTADLNKLLDPGTKVFVTATEPGKSESPKAETPVIRDKDGNWEADTGSKLSTPVIDPIRENDEKVVVAAPKADDKIQTIEVSDQKGNTVKLTKDPADTTGKTWKAEGTNDTVKENNDGKLEIPVKDKLPLNDRDQIKVTFKDGEKPTPNEAFDKAPVQKASQTPIVDPVYTGDKSVKIVDPTVADPTAKTIKVKVGDNDSMTVEKQADGSWKVKEDPNKEVKVEDGKIVVPLDPSAKKDEVIKVSTINDSGKASPAAEVKVEDRIETKKPTIDRANKDENSVSGTAAPNAEITVTVTPKGGEPKTFTGKAGADGNYKVTTDPLVDGDTVVVKASELGKADNTSDPKVVGVDTSKLKESIEKAEDPTIGGKDGANLNPDTNKVDKELKDALDKAKEVKEKGDNGDPNTDQKAVDKAKEDLDKAIAQKEADTAVDKAKDNPTPENIKDAQDKIGAIPGSTDPEAEDYNPIKKELQDKLDLIEKIKEGEDRLKQDDVTGANDTAKKPQKDIDALKKAVQDGKDALDKNNKDKYGEKTKELEKAINILNQERINVSFKAVSFGDQTLFLRTSVPGARITVSINGKIITKSKARNKEGELIDVDYVTTDAFGTYTLYFGNIKEDGHDFTNGLSENDEIIVNATKDGYNPGEYTEFIY